MAKAPSTQFYPADWMRDLSEHPLEIEGAWIRICCHLFYSETKGKATKTLPQWSRILRSGAKKSLSIIAYLDNQKIADVVNQNEGIEITSRRMVRDEELKKIRYLAGIRGGNPSLISEERKSALDNQNLLKLNRRSSSSSSSSEQIHRAVFVPPTVDEVRTYIQEQGVAVDPDAFVNFYESKGWMIGKNKMKSWKAAVRTWAKGSRVTAAAGPGQGNWRSKT
jgi:hypothetical protein